MTADAPPGAVERTPGNDEIYRAIRSEIQAEISLISARVNWLVASQAFLFTPLVIGMKGSRLVESLLWPLIPVLGLVLCLLILVSILAAVWRSEQWRAKARRGAYAGEREPGEFSIVLPHTPAIPVMGYLGSVGVPAALAATWAALLVAPPSLG